MAEREKLLSRLKDMLTSEHSAFSQIKGVEKLSEDTDLKQDLGFDSLDGYEFIYEVEKELEISIPDERADEFETIGDYIDYIQSVRR
jgi:acyl carrier protein